MPLFAASFGAGASQRLRTGLRQAATWIAVLVVAFGLPVALLRDDALRVFSSDPAVLRIGLTVLAAQLVAALFNGFTALVTTLFQATAQAGPAAVMGVTQGLLVLPVMLAGNALFGLTGLVWSVTVAEVACFALAMVLLAARRARTFAPRLA
jgi:Na+-driven multidrug efflux pump